MNASCSSSVFFSWLGSIVALGSGPGVLVARLLFVTREADRYSQWKMLVMFSTGDTVGLVANPFCSPSPRLVSSIVTRQIPFSVLIQAPRVPGMGSVLASGGSRVDFRS